MVQIDDLGKVIRHQFGSKVKAVYLRADTHSLQVFPGAYVSEDAMLTIGFIADTFAGLAGTNIGRPMIDQTGLSGTFDFTLEWTPERRDLYPPPGGTAQFDSPGPAFTEALQEQLGIKLQPRKGSISVLVLDHVERPSAN